MFRNVRLSRDQRFARGFSLIELMIVVAVVAILAAIAFPSYQEYVRKSRRAQAKADLVELTQLAERYHTTNNTYVGFAPPFDQSPRTGQGWYRVAPSNVTQSAFTFTADPQGAQDVDKCGALTINQANVKGSEGTLSECW